MPADDPRREQESENEQVPPGNRPNAWGHWWDTVPAELHRCRSCGAWSDADNYPVCSGSPEYKRILALGVAAEAARLKSQEEDLRQSAAQKPSIEEPRSASAQQGKLRQLAQTTRELLDQTPFSDEQEAVIFSALKACAKQCVGWQDISTAPKDGTRILLARKRTVSEELSAVSGHWNSGDAFNLPHWSTGIAMHDPTHWMVLPPLSMAGFAVASNERLRADQNDRHLEASPLRNAPGDDLQPNAEFMQVKDWIAKDKTRPHAAKAPTPEGPHSVSAQLQELVLWLLGERGVFPAPPEDWRQFCWWRKELRARYEAIIQRAAASESESRALEASAQSLSTQPVVGVSAARRRQDEWQPIETAPKDGTALCYFAGGWRSIIDLRTLPLMTIKPTHWRVILDPPCVVPPLRKEEEEGNSG